MSSTDSGQRWQISCSYMMMQEASVAEVLWGDLDFYE